MEHPSAYIAFAPGRTIDFEKPQQVDFVLSTLLKTIEILTAPAVELVTRPWAIITVDPSAHILSSDGVDLTADGETLSW